MSLRQRNNLKGISREPQSSQLTLKDEAGALYVLAGLRVAEKLSSPSHIEATVLSPKADPSSWLGQSVCCEVFDQVASSRSAVRSYRGVVVAVEVLFSTEEGKEHCFYLDIRPWFSLLQYSRNCRVFQNKSTQEVVTSIFDELGFKGKYKANALASTKREYCVQYNETDFDFVNRVLAQQGIHYYFDSDEDSETLVLQDAAKPFSDKLKQSFDFVATREGALPLIAEWMPAMRYHAAKLELASYDPEQSKMVKSAATPSKYTLAANSKLVDFRYPQASITGGQDDLAKELVKIKRAELDSQHALVKASTSSMHIYCGTYLNLASHNDPSQIGDYLVISCDYHYSVDSDGALSQDMTFSCSPKAHDYFPAQLAKPLVQGMHSAVASGSKDGEPCCDDQGQVKIKFHWDDSSGDKTSCWVRVAQSMAGNGYGVQFVPRAGQEVLVSFLDGDIDRPVVTGSLYNSKHKAPYAEQETTQSGIKTKLEGESNELRFDDKADSEQLYLHAAKDYLLEVENDKAVKVLNDASEAVTGSQTLTVEKDITTSTEKNYSLSAKEAISENAKTITLEADEAITLKVGASEIKISSSKIELKSGEISVKGNSKVAVQGGQVEVKGDSNVKVDAGMNLDLKGGLGIKLSGMNVDLSADMNATVKGNLKTEVSSGLMTTVKGAMVMVN